MKKLWIYIAFLAILGASGLADSPHDNLYDDYDDLWYNDLHDEIESVVEDAENETVTSARSDIINDKKVEEDIQKFRNEKAESLGDDEYDNFENIDDYQIEDNRSEVKEDKKGTSEEIIDDFIKKGYFDDVTSKSNGKDGEVESKNSKEYLDSEEPVDISAEDEDADDNDDLFEPVVYVNNDDVIEGLKGTTEHEDERPFDSLDEEEAKVLKKEENDNDDEIEDSEEVIDTVEDDIDNNKEVDDEFKDLDESYENETTKTTNNLDQNQESTSNVAGVIDESKHTVDEDEDTDDFNDDIPKHLDDVQKGSNIEDIISETKKLLGENSEAFDEEDVEESINEHAQNNENENGDIKKNSTEVMNQEIFDRQYMEVMDNLDNLINVWEQMKLDSDNTEVKVEDMPGFEEVKSEIEEMERFAHENNFDIIGGHFDFSKVFADERSLNIENENEKLSTETDVDNSKTIPYVNDALDANEGAETTTSEIETSTATNHVVQEHKVEPLEGIEDNALSSSELDQIINDLLDETDKKVEVDTAAISSVEPIRVTLSLDKPYVLTSPNYPSPYPTNAVIDWILEGEGMGIEFNVTDLAVNGHAGDYVLVKPGRVDASGNDGLVFSYTIRTQRMYRFLNVHQMFIRFEAMQGMMWQRGFSFSIKMISAIREEETPEPEPSPIGYPEYSITLNLGGVSLENFLKVEERFREIVADMAYVYINANGIDPGLNTTLEVTQITSRALCFHNWPKFEQCVEVRFGVPLQYHDDDATPRLDEDDLKDMWFTYFHQDPFALRLRRLNITEFQIPNDNSVLMMWLVIAAGVVISMAMLAFALWRFSCFEDYTRMPAFSDTESISEKKTLDLYPTPHQTLPPLYSETDYKWNDKMEESARVDMGGFANRSYVRTDDYDLDSDEEVTVSARDRTGSISPRDIYNV